MSKITVKYEGVGVLTSDTCPETLEDDSVVLKAQHKIIIPKFSVCNVGLGIMLDIPYGFQAVITEHPFLCDLMVYIPTLLISAGDKNNVSIAVKNMSDRVIVIDKGDCLVNLSLQPASVSFELSTEYAIDDEGYDEGHEEIKSFRERLNKVHEWRGVRGRIDNDIAYTMYTRPFRESVSVLERDDEEENMCGSAEWEDEDEGIDWDDRFTRTNHEKLLNTFAQGEDTKKSSSHFENEICPYCGSRDDAEYHKKR